MVLKYLLNHKKHIAVVLIAIAMLLVTYRCGKDSVTITEREKKIEVVKEVIKEIEGNKIEVVKYKDKLQIVKEKETQIVYDTVKCKEIVDNLKEQISLQDTIVIKQDSIIYKYDTITKIQQEIIKEPCKKKLGFGAGFVAGVIVGGAGGVFIAK